MPSAKGRQSALPQTRSAPINDCGSLAIAVLAAVQSHYITAASADQLLGYAAIATSQIEHLPPLANAGPAQGPCPCRRKPIGLLTEKFGGGEIVLIHSFPQSSRAGFVKCKAATMDRAMIYRPPPRRACTAKIMSTTIAAAIIIAKEL